MASVDHILPLGAEVSAKYRGAFCEARVDKITRRATCSVSKSSQHGGLVRVTNGS